MRKSRNSAASNWNLRISRESVGSTFGIRFTQSSQVRPEPEETNHNVDARPEPQGLYSVTLAESKLFQTGGLKMGAQKMHFKMHCVTIQDLLAFGRLPSFSEVSAMGKFVVPEEDDPRPVVFASHQWCGYSHPDPTNCQFEILQGALRTMLSGRKIQPNDCFVGEPGQPKARRFDSMLKNCLIWFDYISVPQLRARHQDEDTDLNEPEGDVHAMLKAINSIPAYISRSSLFFVLAPVVEHHEEPIDCQFQTWKQRGWCRFEIALAALLGKAECAILIESATSIIRFGYQQYDLMTNSYAGLGEFACCKRNHTVEVNGVPTTIGCDKDKISDVLSVLVEEQLAQFSHQKDLAEYRWLLAHRYEVLRGLQSAKELETYNNWCSFAKAFHLDVNKPLKKCGGKHNFSPLIYAVLAQNLPIVKYLLACKADASEVVPYKIQSVKRGCNLLHLIVYSGHGESAKQIFDILLAAKADPYQFSRRARTFGRPFCQDPLAIGVGWLHNAEMCIHYMRKVKPRWTAMAETWGATNEIYICCHGQYDVFLESLKHGATSRSRNPLGMDVFAMHCAMPKEFASPFNKAVLDAYNEHGWVGDLNGCLNYQKGVVAIGFGMCWYLRHMGLFKNDCVFHLMYCLGSGTYLHACVYRDKPEHVAWLLDQKADSTRKNRRGQTPLDLAVELGYRRCVAVLTGDKTACRRYSTQIYDAPES